jgi:hypothetical protein
MDGRDATSLCWVLGAGGGAKRTACYSRRPLPCRRSPSGPPRCPFAFPLSPFFLKVRDIRFCGPSCGRHKAVGQWPRPSGPAGFLSASVSRSASHRGDAARRSTGQSPPSPYFRNSLSIFVSAFWVTLSAFAGFTTGSDPSIPAAISWTSRLLNFGPVTFGFLPMASIWQHVLLRSRRCRVLRARKPIRSAP